MLLTLLPSIPPPLLLCNICSLMFWGIFKKSCILKITTLTVHLRCFGCIYTIYFWLILAIDYNCWFIICTYNIRECFYVSICWFSLSFLICNTGGFRGICKGVLGQQRPPPPILWSIGFFLKAELHKISFCCYSLIL